MFAHLRSFQPEVAASLSAQLGARQFAHAHLYSGSPYSLRMHFALESVRILGCREEGSSTCSCRACTQHRLLRQENLLIVTKRDHRRIIECQLHSYEQLGTDFSQIALIRAIRVLLLGHHPELSALKEAAAVDELLIPFGKTAELEKRERSLWVKDLRRAVNALFKAMKKNTTITVDQVRSVAQWTSRSTIESSRQFIIIEAIEETGVSARNALLKMLEEPPEGVYFFLISEHPARIMQTILSRVRHTRFGALTPSALTAYLAPYYPKRDYGSLEEFVLERGGLDVSAISASASEYLATVLHRRTLSSTALASLLGSIAQADGIELFMEALIEAVQGALANDQISLAIAERMLAEISSHYRDGMRYSQDVQMIGQGLYYRLQEVV